MTAVSLYLTSGELAEAVRAGELLDEMVQGLTPHHRLHGVATRISVETVRGGWARVRELTEQAERAVKANSAAPCPSNASCLFNCALASVRCGDEDEAARLEAEADAEIRDVYRAHYSAAKLRLALARNNLRDVKRLVGSFELGPFGWMGGIDAVPALFDALVVLGERDRIQAEAAEFHHAGAYIELFALRALGVARGDEQLLEQASTHFREMGLDWRADETDDLFREKIAAKSGTRKETE
jgi:hypothetical protein